MSDIRLVGLEKVNPKKERPVDRSDIEVRRHLPLPKRGVRKLDLRVLEAQMLLFETREAILVDEEDCRRVECSRAPTVQTEKLRPGLRVLAKPKREKRTQV